MKRDYIHIKHTKTVTRQQVERQEEVINLMHKPLTIDLSHQVLKLYPAYQIISVNKQKCLMKYLLELQKLI